MDPACTVGVAVIALFIHHSIVSTLVVSAAISMDALVVASANDWIVASSYYTVVSIISFFSVQRDLSLKLAIPRSFDFWPLV